MTSPEIFAVLEVRFGDAVVPKADALDPFAVVGPANLVAVCSFLRDDPRLRFEMLNCVTGVDYLETDAKKAPEGRLRAAPRSRLPPVELHARASVRRSK